MVLQRRGELFSWTKNDINNGTNKFTNTCASLRKDGFVGNSVTQFTLQIPRKFEYGMASHRVLNMWNAKNMR